MNTQQQGTVLSLIVGLAVLIFFIGLWATKPREPKPRSKPAINMEDFRAMEMEGYILDPKSGDTVNVKFHWLGKELMLIEIIREDGWEDEMIGQLLAD